MAEIYRAEFDLDLLGQSFTSAGSVMAGHLEEVTNAAAVQGFSDIKNSTIGKILLAARNGGVTESRVTSSERIWDGGNKRSEKVVALDLIGLYPSTQVIYPCMIGEPTVYSPSSPGVLSAVSNHNPYGSEYKSCAMLRHELTDRFGDEVLSMRSNHTNERIAVLPKYWPDAFAVSKTKDGKCMLTFLMHDGFFHVREKGLHHARCQHRTEENDFDNSPHYEQTMVAHENNYAFCKAVFSPYFDLRFVQTTDCHFHSPYTLADGTRHKDMGSALEVVRMRRPELCISASHPSKITWGEVFSQKERADGTVLTGFVVLR